MDAATGKTEGFGGVMQMSERPLVIKFGGTSVGDGARFANAAKIAVEAARQRPVAVVVSAMSGTTDALIGCADATSFAGESRTSSTTMSERSLAELRNSLEERHLSAAREAVSEEHLPAVEERLRELLDLLEDAVEAPFEDAEARRDGISAFGEQLSATILAGAIESLGDSASVVAGDPIATDSTFGDGTVDAAGTRERCSRYVAPILEDGAVAVVPGFVGRSPEGLPVTLGRGGSDLSATAVGQALDSEEVWIMSDVDGVLSADPRLVSEAFLLPRLSYQEAATFASLGAKVLHPKTMEPALASGMKVLVKNTFDPAGSGTSVSVQEDVAGVRCVALRRGISFEIPCSSGHRSAAAAVVCIGAPQKADISAGHRKLRKAGISPLHYGVASPGLVFVVAEEDAEEALRVLHGALVRESVESNGIAEGVA